MLQRRVRIGVAAALAVAVTFVIGTDAASSAPPAAGYMKAPPSVYTPVDTNLVFTGADPYIGYPLELKLEAGDDGGDCDHGDSPTDGDIGPTGGPSGGCATVQMDVNHGKLTMAGANSGDGGGLTGGAEILSATTLPNAVVNIFGTYDEVNAALATLTYIPDAGYESTTGSDGPDDLTMFAYDGAGVKIEMAEQTDMGLEVVGDGDIEVAINVEQPNDPPELTMDIPAGLRTFTASADPGNLDSNVIRDTDPGVTITLEDPDIDDGEPDDYLLVVAWIDGTGRFGLGFGSAACVGAPADLITVAFCPEVPANLLPIAQLLPDLPNGLNFGTTPSSYNEAIAFVASRSDAQDLLSYIDYETPATDADDTITVLVSDLGNNGLPLKPNVEVGVAVPDPLGYDFTSFDLTVRDDTNDPPVVTAPAATSVNIGGSVAVPFSVTDSDAGSGTLTATIMGSGVTPSATNLSGDLSSLNSQLAALTATGVTEGPGSVTVVVDDGGNTPPPAEQGQATATIDVIDPNATSSTSSTSTSSTSSSSTSSSSSSTSSSSTSSSSTSSSTSSTSSSTSTSSTSTSSTSSTSTSTSSTSTSSTSTSTSSTSTSSTSTSTSSTSTSTTSTSTTSTTSTTTSTTEPGSTTSTSEGGTTTTTSDGSTTTVDPGTVSTTDPGSVSGGGIDQGGGTGGSGTGTVGSGSIVRTGADAAGTVASGVALLLAGTVLLVIRRRSLRTA